MLHIYMYVYIYILKLVYTTLNKVKKDVILCIKMVINQIPLI